jgi:hypothetical protein
MAIKRNITDISTLKRGANTLSAVYRGTSLIWPSNPPVEPGFFINTWLLDTGYYPLEPTGIQDEKLAMLFRL